MAKAKVPKREKSMLKDVGGSVPEVDERMESEVMAGRRGGLYTFLEVFEKVAAIWEPAWKQLAGCSHGEG